MSLSERAARSKDRNFKTPALQHRHFAFIAGCIREIPTPAARIEAARAFSTNLAASNAAFDRSRFMDACDCVADQMTEADLNLAIAYGVYWLEHLQNERLRRDANARSVPTPREQCAS